MKDRKIATVDGITFAYRDPKENEKTYWQLKGKPVIPVAVPDPADDNCERDLGYWSFSLDDEDLEFSIQYYYDRWNFSDDSCRKDKDIVDALVVERDGRKNRTQQTYSGYSNGGSSRTWGAGGGNVVLVGGKGGNNCAAKKRK